LFVAVGTDVSTFLNGTKSLLSNYKNLEKSDKTQSIY
jgi:hypothetical protein